MSDSKGYPFTLAYVAGEEGQGPSRAYEPTILLSQIVEVEVRP